MKKNFLYVSLILTGYLFPCCHQSQSPSSSKNDSVSKGHYSSDDIPEFRKQVKKEAVAVYKEKTDNPLNDWYFSVRLCQILVSIPSPNCARARINIPVSLVLLTGKINFANINWYM